MHRSRRLRGVWCRIAAIACAVAAGLAGSADAQHVALPEHRPRPLHQRLAESEVLTFASVEAVELGRIRVADPRPLRGDPAPAFELKRAPSAPPPLAAGDRALLLLRGARSPYLLVDEADELWKAAPDDDEAALAQALGALDADRGSPRAVAARYAAWLGSPSAPLQRWAAQGFEGDAAVLAQAPPPALANLVELALGAPDATLRDAAARAALQSEAGLARLLAGLPGAAADPEVVGHALYAGLAQPEGRAAAERCLAATSPAVRGAVLRFGTLLGGDPSLRAALQRVASEDPDEALRLAARRALAGR